MKTMIAVMLLGLALPARAQWVGKLDLQTAPALGAWQSLDSTDQAYGLSKRLWSLSKGGQEVLRVGIFAGLQKPTFEPKKPLQPLGGVTTAVPGSALDWALGTKWGDAWLPKLKTGVLIGWDLFHPSGLHAAPDFKGIGAAWPFGGT